MLSAWRLSIGVLTASLGLFPVLFLTHYQQRYGFDSWIVVFGTGLIVSAVLLIMCVALLLQRAQRVPMSRRWLTASLTVLLGGMTFIYAGAYISNAVWGDTLTWTVALTFATQIQAVLAFLPLSATQKTMGLTAAVLGGLGFLALTLYLCARFTQALEDRTTAWEQARPGRRRGLMAGLSTATFFSTGVCVGIGWFQTTHLLGEPVSAFFMVFSPAKTAKLNHARLAAVIEDRDSRASYAKPAEFDRKNVIVIFSDALRADRMGIYGYGRPTTPFLSSLAAKGQLHRVEMALASCSESYCGIASTFAGRPFHEISVQNLKLHQLLHDQGYGTKFYLSGDHRSWQYLQDFYGPEAQTIYDAKTMSVKDINDDENLMQALDQLSPITSQPQFLYFFLMSTHISGHKRPEFERYQPTRIDGARIMTFWNELAGQVRVDGQVSAPTQRLKPEEFAALSNRYDNGVLQSDDYMRRIFATLDAKGYLANSIVVILGDHGDSLGEKGHIGHTRFLYQEDIRIPLLIYDQDVSRYKNAEFATQSDIAPTILQRLGLPVPSGWSDHSLLQPARERISLHQTRRGKESCYAAVRSAPGSLHKYMRCDGASGGHGELLYDLRSDPTEQKNLMASGNAALIARLRGEITANFKPTP